MNLEKINNSLNLEKDLKIPKSLIGVFLSLDKTSFTEQSKLIFEVLKISKYRVLNFRSFRYWNFSLEEEKIF